ncbi:MAG TPA: CsgG/HfaB family protein [Chthonomonadales bacterium]|nr:CsgG/HfaB family protein [Chthonomonadales bacterium]
MQPTLLWSKLVRSLVLVLCVCSAQAALADVPKYPNVRVMVVVPEWHLTRPVVDPAGETSIIRALLDAGYRVIDQTQSMALRTPEKVAEILRAPIGAEARNAMARYGADILIIGEAFSESAGIIRGAHSCRARLEATAILRDSAEILAREDGHGSGADITELVAAKTALSEAGKYVAAKLLKRIGKAVGGPVGSTVSHSASQQAPADHDRSGRPIVAVFPFDDRSRYRMVGWEQGKQIPDLINMALLKTGRVDVVEMTDIEAVVGSMGDQLSGLYDNPGRMAKLGGLKGARFGVIGRITEFATKIDGMGVGPIRVRRETATVTILLKLVDLQTGQLYAADQVSGKVTSTNPRLHGYSNLSWASMQDTCLGRAVTKAVNECVKKIIGTFPQICSHCGKTLKGDAKFCNACGGKVAEAQVADLKCPNARCKAAVSAGDAFCPECGTALRNKE